MGVPFCCCPVHRQARAKVEGPIPPHFHRLEQGWLSGKVQATMASQQSRIHVATERALAGATVITANTRAARRLRLEVEWRAFQTKFVFESPDILPFDAWIGRTWSDALLAGVVDRALLKPNVIATLWREI